MWRARGRRRGLYERGIIRRDSRVDSRASSKHPVAERAFSPASGGPRRMWSCSPGNRLPEGAPGTSRREEGELKFALVLPFVMIAVAPLIGRWRAEVWLKQHAQRERGAKT